MEDYAADIRKYSPEINEKALAGVVRYCGIALRDPDASLVSVTAPAEMKTVREGFATKKLGLTPEAADAGIRSVVEKVKGARRKSRVTFYYLLAEATGTLDKLA